MGSNESKPPPPPSALAVSVARFFDNKAVRILRRLVGTATITVVAGTLFVSGFVCPPVAIAIAAGAGLVGLIGEWAAEAFLDKHGMRAKSAAFDRWMHHWDCFNLLAGMAVLPLEIAHVFAAMGPASATAAGTVTSSTATTGARVVTGAAVAAAATTATTDVASAASTTVPVVEEVVAVSTGVVEKAVELVRSAGHCVARGFRWAWSKIKSWF